MYAMAIGILRLVDSSEFFKSTRLAPMLLADPNEDVRKFWRTVSVLGKADDRGHFIPHTEPSGFQTHDGPSLRAAEEIVRGYVTASTNNPDFREIKEKYNLPDPDEARTLLP